jgi:hypothetical protein
VSDVASGGEDEAVLQDTARTSGCSHTLQRLARPTRSTITALTAVVTRCSLRRRHGSRISQNFCP